MSTTQAAPSATQSLAIAHILSVVGATGQVNVEVHDKEGFHVLGIRKDGSLTFSAYAGDAVLINETLKDVPWGVLGLALDLCAEAGHPF